VFQDPIVKVVVEDSISSLEVQILEDGCVVHEIQAVVDIVALLFGED
jgi:hypothetical protein